MKKVHDFLYQKMESCISMYQACINPFLKWSVSALYQPVSALYQSIFFAQKKLCISTVSHCITLIFFPDVFRWSDTCIRKSQFFIAYLIHADGVSACISVYLACIRHVSHCITLYLRHAFSTMIQSDTD